MRIFDTTLKTGGLLRCCGQAFAQHARNHSKEVFPGDVVTCPHCDSDIGLNDAGVWEWLKNKTPRTLVRQ